MPAGCGQLLLLVVVAAVSVDSETLLCGMQECPNFRSIHHYEELGCRRSDGTDDCCPTRFNCSSLLSLDKTKCHYKGKAYEPGTTIPQEIRHVCTSGCECVNALDGTSNGEASINCSIIHCDLKFSVGCLGTHSFDQCCSTGEYCVFPTDDRPGVAQCTYNGKKYSEGQFIDVPGCQTCLCQAGFNGTLDGPWCRRISCEYAVNKKPSELASCAPVYWKYTKCCPLTWHCPSPNDTVTRHSGFPTEEDEQCSFGDHRLKIGDELRSTTGNSVECKCEMPPFITCKLISLAQYNR